MLVSCFALAAVYTAVSGGQLFSSNTVGPRVCCGINDSSDINSEPCQTFCYAAMSVAEGVDFVIVSSQPNIGTWKENRQTTRLPQKTYFEVSVKSDGWTGLHVYAHRLVNVT